MKKEMTINNSWVGTSDEKQIVEMIMDSVRIPGKWLRRYYSAIMGHEVSTRPASLITRTQLAFIAILLTAGHSVLLLAASVAWFAVSLMKCTRYI